MPRLAVAAALALILALPFLVRATGTQRGQSKLPPDSLKLVVITPHVEQIRDEFARAFDRWHFRTHNQHIAIDYRTPGGTSDIIKQLESTFEAAAKNGLIDSNGRAKPGAAGCDLFFGGGSFEHGKMKEKHTAIGPGGTKLEYRMGQPAAFDKYQLASWFGENKIGTQTLYDPDQYWIGTALSGFGIVYNTDLLRALTLPEPRSFADLTDPRYFNLLALADGRQSGSITTTYDSILNKEGWDRGWRILREMSANARYFASSSTKPPIDVSQGDAAAGLAIDFYGRGQSQFLLKPGQDPKTARMGYIDPEGATYIDADPCSIVNGALNFDLAKRFIEFCLTAEAQSLWQFRNMKTTSIPRLTTPTESIAPVTGEFPMPPNDPMGRPFGPDQYELRRMPVRRGMYEWYSDYFVDKTHPFKVAIDVKQQNWRSAIAPMMAAFAIDTSSDLREAWRTLNQAREAGKSGRFPTEKLQQMEHLFYAFPPHHMRDGSTLDFTEQNFAAIKKDTNSWKDLDHGKRSLIAYTAFFRENYRQVIELGEQAARP